MDSIWVDALTNEMGMHGNFFFMGERTEWSQLKIKYEDSLFKARIPPFDWAL